MFERNVCKLVGSCLSCGAGLGVHGPSVYCLHATQARAGSVSGHDLTKLCAACILVPSVPIV